MIPILHHKVNDRIPADRFVPNVVPKARGKKPPYRASIVRRTGGVGVNVVESSSSWIPAKAGIQVFSKAHGPRPSPGRRFWSLDVFSDRCGYHWTAGSHHRHPGEGRDPGNERQPQSVSKKGLHSLTTSVGAKQPPRSPLEVKAHCASVPARNQQNSSFASRMSAEILRPCGQTRSASEKSTTASRSPMSCANPEKTLRATSRSP